MDMEVALSSVEATEKQQ